MKATLACLSIAALLASCAPALNPPVTGRIVNATTGQEGTITFSPGALSTRAGDPFAGNNTTIQIGGQTFGGRTVLLDASTTVTVRPAVDVGFGFGTGPYDDPFFGTRVGTTTQTRTGLRTGNLIAKSFAAPARTITCTLQVNDAYHGVGDCTGSDGARYALQF
ncbi:hypothetical protein DAETH_19230 [Deinococcus aetherius]|uniref:Lipoprotein n=2 Tax=Deinococcus aetherius TaxID=200252 RepID=A0ABM8ADT1_9DEIO|nr:hypothetical protein DAETH_19230 [Deinococcus aetherius]